MTFVAGWRHESVSRGRTIGKSATPGLKAHHAARPAPGGRIPGVSAAALGVYGSAVEPQSLIVTRYAFTPPGWPAGFRRSLTVIADLHAGGPDMTFKHVRQVVDTASSLRSDIVLLLGDYITTHNWERPVTYDMWSGELARLTAPLGVWAILGNHDW